MAEKPRYPLPQLPPRPLGLAAPVNDLPIPGTFTPQPPPRKTVDEIMRSLSYGISQDIGQAGSGIARALMTPGNALRGDYNEVSIYPSGYVSPVSEALVQDASNMAGVVTTGSMPIARPRGSIGTGGSEIFTKKSSSFEELLAVTRERMAARENAVNEIINSGRTSVRMKGKSGMALVGPDMSVPGKYRVTYFDPQGVPNGHVELPTYADALQRAIQDGFFE